MNAKRKYQIALERQNKRVIQLDNLKKQHSRLADKLHKLEMRIEKLNYKIEYE